MKQPSLITIAKIGPNYSLDARGAFGGGWRVIVKESELSGRLIRAWQMFGNNRLGCTIVGDLPGEIKALAEQLMAGKEKMISVRMSGPEISIINQAAEAIGESQNQWCRRVLLEEATK